jgi:hypothetical protein
VANLFSATVETSRMGVVLGFVRLGVHRSSCATNTLTHEDERRDNEEEMTVSNGARHR